MKKKKLWFLFVLTLLLMAVPSTSFAFNGDVYQQGFVEGYLLDVMGGNTLHVETYQGERYYLPVAIDAVYSIDNTLVPISVFKPGMEIYGKLTRARGITYLEGYSTANLGYILPGDVRRVGMVTKIDRNQLWVKLPTGQEKLYFTTPATLVMRNGERALLSTLYVGDRVKLFFDEVNSNVISTMQIQGESILLQGLYKGKLNGVNQLNETVTIQDVKVFRNGRWEDSNPSMSINFTSHNPIYIGGYPVNKDRLQYYRGSEVYLAVKDFFGRGQVERMVIKNQYETTYSDKIEAVNFYTQSFELANKRNFGFHDGTIVVRNGRLVDKESIFTKADAFVVGDGRGDYRQADVVYIYNEDINNSNIGHYQLYAGRLNTIVENKLWLKDFFLLNANDWESFSDEKELFYDNDTHIYDLENKKQLTVKEFFSGNYAVDEDSIFSDRNNRDWYGYVYTDGDRIVGITVKKDMDSLLRQRVTNGIIAHINHDPLVGWAITLNNASDWSTRNEQWMAKNSAIRLNLEEALIIKGEEVIEPADLSVGHRLYLVRDDFKGKVIIVK